MSCEPREGRGDSRPAATALRRGAAPGDPAMAGRGCGCSCGPGYLNEDNARFLLLAALIVLYLLGGAAVFSALELAHERQAKQRWEERLANFSRRHNLSRDELRGFLRHYEEATEAGIRVDSARPRWDFTGAFYFVGTVVSTIGKRASLGGEGVPGPAGPFLGPLGALAFLHPRAQPGGTDGSCRLVHRWYCLPAFLHAVRRAGASATPGFSF